jgi:hypothetical protein
MAQAAAQWQRKVGSVYLDPGLGKKSKEYGLRAGLILAALIDGNGKSGTWNLSPPYG